MQHIHIVQGMDPLHGGGLGQSAVQLHRAMRSIGLPSILLTTGVRNTDPTAGTVVLKRRFPAGFYRAPELRTVVKMSLTRQSVVHLHGLFTYANWAVPPLVRASNAALVIHPHGMLEPWALRQSGLRKRAAFAAFEDRNFRQATLVRALTGAEERQVRSRYRDARVAVLPNGVDENLFPKGRPQALEHRTRIILHLGRLHPKKGIDLLLRAYASLAHPEHSMWTVVIAGPDEGGYLAHLENLAAELGIADKVMFAGQVVGKEKQDLLGRAEIFVLASRSEGLPMAPLEAMASGLPIVATDACNLDGIDEHGAGFVCQPSEGSLKDALRRMMRLPDEARRKMGSRGSEWMRESFRWKPIAAELDRVLRQTPPPRGD